MTEERRLVSVLFADVSGSTALGETMDPEDMRALLGRYYAIARAVIEEHGGTLEKFIGDAVMAVFGLPTAHDDDAARAANAALALRNRVRDDATLGERLPIRLGLSTGEVVAAVGPTQGAGDFLITGDVVNVAARLQQSADRWEILCTDRTARAAGDGFVFGPLTELEARGRAIPVPARRLEGVAVSRPRTRTPFLGRDDDVAQLDLTAGRAFREKRPYLATITAPAGTGKTRLLEEFLARLPTLTPDARVLTTQCLPYGQQLTYLPLRTLLRDLLALPEEAELDVMRVTAEAWLAGAGDPQPGRTAELLSATFGAGEHEPIDRAELFAAWRSTIELAANEQPLVLVVEDLHWSSDSLLDLIDVILQPRGEAPLMMIVLARPELLDRRPTWGGGRRNYVSLALEPLDDLAISALVDFLLHAPPPEVVETVVSRAEGNPFYAGELCRTISERATDMTDPSAVSALLATLPDTVHATVLARLDLLPPQARRVIQLGSIFGRSFVSAGITAVEPALHDQVAEVLEHLRDHDLIRSVDAEAYVFRHILIRDVGYQTLPRSERARLHAMAGTWLEDRAGGHAEERAELVAFHFREAVILGSAAGVEPDPALIRKAVTWLRLAADAAYAGAGYAEAIRHLQAAIEFAPREDLPDLLVSVGDIFGGGAGAVDAYARAADIGRELGRSPDFILRALSGQLMVLGRWAGSVGGEPPHTEELIAAVRAARQEATDPETIGYSYVAEAFSLVGAFTSGYGSLDPDSLRASAAIAERAVAIGRELDDAPLLSAALDALGGLLLDHDPVRGLEYARERLAIEHRLPLNERSDVHNMLAWNLSALGRLEDVREATDSMLRDVAPNQAQALMTSLSAWEAWALALMGRWLELGPSAERAYRLWNDAGRFSAGFALHGYMAILEVGWALGDERLAGRGREVVQAITEQFPPDQIFGRLSAFAGPDTERLAATVVGDWEPYVTRLHLVERALSLCVDRHQPISADVLDRLVAESASRSHRLLHAQALRARGVATGSAQDLGAARDLFVEFGAQPLVARAELELGTVTQDPGLIASGTAGLDALGDVGHLGRVGAAVR